MLCTCTATLANGEHRALLLPDERQCTVLDYATVSVLYATYTTEVATYESKREKAAPRH